MNDDLLKQMLKGFRVAFKEELSERIYQYFDEINVRPVELTEKFRKLRLKDINLLD